MIFEEDETNKDGMDTIVLDEWCSFGVIVDKDVPARKNVERVDCLMRDLVDKGYIQQWFFLYEGKYIAVRAQLPDEDIVPMQRYKASLRKKVQKLSKKYDLTLQEKSFATYKEKKGKMFNEEVMLAFANMMTIVTDLCVNKLAYETNFSSYRFMERVSHCMFNSFCGGFIHSLKDEKYFLHQRILERDKSMFDDEFEDASMPKVKLKKYYG
jgi:hypothetical protein